ncbi:unnamed protein product [Blepharisma stoltei]|uniref:Uncharacterized protein n=1 Tax=Blepharisma stoltei TaxID=1481888 RepID=A0AAU9IVT7_9CILI|nr:unnamed protein product [Blepharisma stoltei]
MSATEEQNEILLESQYYRIVDQEEKIKEQEEIIQRLKTENENFYSQLCYVWEKYKGYKELKIEIQNDIGVNSPIYLPIKRKHQGYNERKLIRDKDESSWNVEEDSSYENFKMRLEVSENEKKEIENEKEILSQKLNECYNTIENLKSYQFSYQEYKNKYESLLENEKIYENNFASFKISNQQLAEKIISYESRINYLENINQAANEEIIIKSDEYESELRKNAEFSEELQKMNKIIEEKENENKSLLLSFEKIRSENLNCSQQNSGLIKQNYDFRNYINCMEENLKQKENQIRIQEKTIYDLTLEIEKQTQKNQEQQIVLNRATEELSKLKNNPGSRSSELEKISKDLEESSKNYEKARIKLTENQGIIGDYKWQLINQGNQVKIYCENIISSLEETINELSDKLLFTENELQKQNLLNFNTFQ